MPKAPEEADTKGQASTTHQAVLRNGVVQEHLHKHGLEGVALSQQDHCNSGYAEGHAQARPCDVVVPASMVQLAVVLRSVEVHHHKGDGCCTKRLQQLPRPMPKLPVAFLSHRRGCKMAAAQCTGHKAGGSEKGGEARQHCGPSHGGDTLHEHKGRERENRKEESPGVCRGTERDAQEAEQRWIWQHRCEKAGAEHDEADATGRAEHHHGDTGDPGCFASHSVPPKFCKSVPLRDAQREGHKVRGVEAEPAKDDEAHEQRPEALK
mmetsp:Transcript_131879/g.281991  ORF Transcript_131879/g.281991 Transcript_131879/m.281991 type:complete len:265 (-) Transcript_131879:441-1235(-)